MPIVHRVGLRKKQKKRRRTFGSAAFLLHTAGLSYAPSGNLTF
jgi:hypothetical protein